MSAKTKPDKGPLPQLLSPTQNQTLIALVKKNPIIYDMKSRTKNEVIKYEKAWRAIATELRKDVKLLKSQWRCFRDRYVKKRKSAKKTGASLADNPLSFLDPLLCKKEQLGLKTTSNTTENALKSDSKRSKQKKNATRISQEMIDTILKHRNEDPITNQEYIQPIHPIENYVTTNIESTVLETPITNLNVGLVPPTYTMNVSGVDLIVVPPASSLPEHDNICDYLSSFSPDATPCTTQYLVEPSESNNNLISISDPKDTNTAHSIVLSSFGDEAQEGMEATTIEEEINVLNKMKAPDEMLDCVKYGHKEDKTEKASILDVNCDETDLKVLFNDLAEYVSNRFTIKKQMEIRFQICELVTKAELEELDENEKNGT